MDSPKIPTLKDSQKPQVKLRGLGAGATLFDRIKQFKKKDLAFILAGLGTLLMAPLAEHFMMAPESGDSALNAGFGKGGNFFPGNGGSPYEPGSSGFAPGGAIGGGSDVITPLNVRDPSALVMGPGSTQQPPAGSPAAGTPPATAPASRSDSDFKDALANSARAAGSAAAKAAKVPVPKIAIAGSGLRGLGVAGGGSSAQAGMGPISAANVTNRVNVGGGMPGVRPLPGYNGVARGPGKGGGGYDKAKAAADAAGSLMNLGKPTSALIDAANAAIPTGGSPFGGGGQGGPGDRDKGGPGNQDKGSKNVGESLAFLKQKKIQEKQIELWGKEREENDMFYQLSKIRNQTLASMASKWGEAMGGCIAKYPGDSCWKPKNTKEYHCFRSMEAAVAHAGDKDYPSQILNIDDVPDKCGDDPGFYKSGSGMITTLNACRGNKNASENPALYCNAFDSKKTADSGPTESALREGTNAATLGEATDKLKDSCAIIDKYSCLDNPASCSAIQGKFELKPELSAAIPYLKGLKEQAVKTVQLRDAISEKSTGSGDCGAPAINVGTNPLPPEGSTDPNALMYQQLALLEALNKDAAPPAVPKGLLPMHAMALRIYGKDDKRPNIDPLPKADEINKNIATVSSHVENIKTVNPVGDKVDASSKDKWNKAFSELIKGSPGDEVAKNSEIAKLTAAQDYIVNAAKEAARVRDQVLAVQKLLDENKGRYSVAFGPEGFTGQMVKSNIEVEKLLANAVFDKDFAQSKSIDTSKLTRPIMLKEIGGDPKANETLASEIKDSQAKLDAALHSKDKDSFAKYEGLKEDARKKAFEATKTVIAKEGFDPYELVRSKALSDLADLSRQADNAKLMISNKPASSPQTVDSILAQLKK